MSVARALTAALFVATALSSQGCSVIFAYVKSGGSVEAAAAEGARAGGAAKEAVDNINAKDERALGQAASLNVIAKNGGLVLEEELNAYVNEVGNLVALHGKRSILVKGNPRIVSRRVFIGVLDSPNQNAFSMPGGYIMVTRGLLKNLGSESELAWVLGHEIAHADGEDGLTALKGQVAAGAFVTGGATDFKDSKFFAKMTDTFVGWLLKKGYDSKAEITADSQGLTYATAAGYDAEGAQRVLRLMNATYLATKKPDAPPDKTHASPEDRWMKLAPKVEALQKAKQGELKVERYEERCIARLDAYVAANPASANGGAP